MPSKNFFNSDLPGNNPHFARDWVDPLDIRLPSEKRDGDSQPIGKITSRIVERVTRQRAISGIAKSLQDAQIHQHDAEACRLAFIEADRLRAQAGMTWAQFVMERAA